MWFNTISCIYLVLLYWSTEFEVCILLKALNSTPIVYLLFLTINYSVNIRTSSNLIPTSNEYHAPTDVSVKSMLHSYKFLPREFLAVWLDWFAYPYRLWFWLMAFLMQTNLVNVFLWLISSSWDYHTKWSLYYNDNQFISIMTRHFPCLEISLRTCQGWLWVPWSRPKRLFQSSVPSGREQDFLPLKVAIASLKLLQIDLIRLLIAQNPLQNAQNRLKLLKSCDRMLSSSRALSVPPVERLHSPQSFTTPSLGEKYNSSKTLKSCTVDTQQKREKLCSESNAFWMLLTRVLPFLSL